MTEITRLLDGVSRGDERAAEHLLEAVANQVDRALAAAELLLSEA